MHRGRGGHGGHISGHPCSSCHHLGGRMCYRIFANMDSKTYVSVFHFLSNSIFPFLSHLFPSLDILILQQVSFCAPAPRFQAKKDSLECQCEVGLSSPPLGDAGGQILVMKWDWGRILVLWEPYVRTSSHYLQGRFAIQSFFSRGHDNPLNLITNPLLTSSESLGQNLCTGLKAMSLPNILLTI